MKIMHIVLNLNIGGLENLVCDMAQVQSQKNETIVCSLEPEEISNRIIKDNGFRVMYLHRRPGKDFRLLFELIRLLKNEKPDVVHAHNRVPLIYGALARFFTKMPVLIHTRHGEEILHKPGFLWDRYNYIVAISHSAKDMLLSHNHIDSKKVRVIHNGIDINRFANRVFGSRKDGKFVIGVVARLDPFKDIFNLIEAFKKVSANFSNAELWIVGDGPLKDSLKLKVKDLRLENSVKFLGWRSDIASINSQMDIFTLPSLTEGISIALLEAMACRLPVVATNVGGNPEVVVDGETGILVSPKEPEKMAEAIVRILSDKDMAKRMGEAGRKRVEEKFSLEKMVKEYEELYESIGYYKSISE